MSKVILNVFLLLCVAVCFSYADIVVGTTNVIGATNAKINNTQKFANKELKSGVMLDIEYTDGMSKVAICTNPNEMQLLTYYKGELIDKDFAFEEDICYKVAQNFVKGWGKTDENK